MTRKGWKFTLDAVVHDMLGIQFNWLTETPGALLLRMPSKILDVKDYFFPGVADADIPQVFDPFPAWWSVDKSEISPTNPAVNATTFRKGFGLIPYNTKIRNDIRVPFCFLATKMQSPSQLDYDAVKHLAAYLWTTREIGLCFHPASSVNGDTSTTLLSATDGSWDPNFPDSKSVLGTLCKIGAYHDPSAPISASTNKESGTCSMSATVCEARALLHGADRVTIYRGIAADLGRPQDLPTTMIQDNAGVIATLNHIVPKAKMKPQRRMFNYLRTLIEDKTITMKQHGTLEQPADALTKRQTAMQNLRSLPMLQGHQPQIEEIFQRYAQHKPTRRLSQSSDTVAAAISLDGYPRLPYHLLDDDSDNVEASLTIARINKAKQESTVIPSKRIVDRIHYNICHLNKWALPERNAIPPEPFFFRHPRSTRLTVTFNLNNN